MKSKETIKAGDIIEIPTEDGNSVVFVQYLGKNSEYGDAVVVSPREYPPNTPAEAALFADSYPIYFPVTLVVKHGSATVRGNAPSIGIPKRWRRPGMREGTSIKSWVIEGGWREVVKKALSDDERKLPIAGVWNLAMLLSRVKEGWRPENVTG